MNYSTFKPSPPSDEEISRVKQRQAYIKKYAEDNNYIRLKCDYFGMSSYFYDDNNKTMYKVCNIFSFMDKSITPTFEVCTDTHIMELNGIKKVTKPGSPDIMIS